MYLVKGNVAYQNEDFAPNSMVSVKIVWPMSDVMENQFWGHPENSDTGNTYIIWALNMERHSRNQRKMPVRPCF